MTWAATPTRGSINELMLRFHIWRVACNIDMMMIDIDNRLFEMLEIKILKKYIFCSPLYYQNSSKYNVSIVCTH